jgi:hypothetical protein
LQAVDEVRTKKLMNCDGATAFRYLFLTLLLLVRYAQHKLIEIPFVRLSEPQARRKLIYMALHAELFEADAP